MADYLCNKLTSLGFVLSGGESHTLEEHVLAFEQRFGLVLPADYRAFLASCGGARGLAVCSLLEPTAFGEEAAVDRFYGFEDDELGDATDLIEGAPDIIALAGEPLGKMYWLFCAGPFLGHVYLHDHQGRSAWPDEQFQQWFPNLAPEIQHYLELRRQGRLPQKPKEFDHVYLTARSFTEFVDRLRPRKDD